MSLATLDTHEVVKDLLTAGFSGEQAEAVARNLRKAQDFDLSSMATKMDLEVVRGDVAKLRGDVQTLEAGLCKEISEAKFEILKWVIGTIGFQTVIILGGVVALIKP